MSPYCVVTLQGALLRPRVCRTTTLVVVATALLAVVTAVVTILPPLRFRAEYPEAAEVGVVFHEAKDAEYYAARIRSVADGTFGGGNDFLLEWSGGERRAAPWTYRLLAALHETTGAELHWVLHAASAVSAAAHVLLFFGIARSLRLSRPSSLAVAALACLAPFVWSYHGYELWLGRPDRPITPFLPLYRAVNPATSSLLVWGVVLFLLRGISSTAPARWATIALLLVASWNAYPPAFVFAGAFVVSAALAAVVTGRWRTAVAALSAVGLAGAVMAPWILATLKSGGAPDALVSNMVALPTRRPILSANVATASALGLLWLFLRIRRRRANVRATFVIGACGALLGVFNLQVVTGRLDQPFHYDWFYSVPLIWILGAVLLSELRSRIRRVVTQVDRRLTCVLAALGISAATTLVLIHGGAATGRILRALGVLRGTEVSNRLRWTALITGVFLAGLVGISAAHRHRWRLLRAGIASVALSFALVEGIRIQEHEYRRRSAAVAACAPLASALSQLAIAGRDDVVACSDEIAARWVPSYTGRKVLVSGEAQFASVPPDEEFRRRRFVQFALFGLSRAALEAGLGDGGRWHVLVFKWRTLAPPSRSLALLSHGIHAARLDPADVERALATYDNYAARSVPELLEEFHVDWVLWREGTPGLHDPGPTAALELVHDSGGVRLYRVRN